MVFEIFLDFKLSTNPLQRLSLEDIFSYLAAYISFPAQLLCVKSMGRTLSAPCRPRCKPILISKMIALTE